MSNNQSGLSPKWKTPDEVMKYHRLKRKLSNRMTRKDNVQTFTFSSNSTNSEDSLLEFPVVKRKTPFFKSFSQPILSKRNDESTDESGVEADVSSHSGDRTLFNLMGTSSTTVSSPKTPTSFKNIIKQLKPTQVSPKAPSSLGVKTIPIDWSLKSKMRFMSTKPFSWSGAMRTCEEVSAVTGFVRCLDPGSKSRPGLGNIDTSPNAQFHQCCLYWQHPHLPWAPIFSRSSKVSPALLTAQLEMADTLLAEWTIAFKSLLQMVRTQQCPFFYMVGLQFHCLFRAAGIAGLPEINAIISPTTRGFRKMLDDEDIAFTMPLKKKKHLDGSGSLDCDTSNNLEVDDDDEDVEEWMESAHARKLTTAQKASDRRRDSKMDGSDDSLVMVSGMDVQGLFNLLVNSKNNMNKVPPTLVSPTAFQLATLQSCQVRDAVVLVDGAQLYSIQIEGPIMPNALSEMCFMLDEAHNEYSAALATVKQTIGFTTLVSGLLDLSSPQSTPSLFFLKENLSDCGLSKRVLSRLCENDPHMFGVIESIEPDHVVS